jgi:hypothetical protein
VLRWSWIGLDRASLITPSYLFITLNFFCGLKYTRNPKISPEYWQLLCAGLQGPLWHNSWRHYCAWLLVNFTATFSPVGYSGGSIVIYYLFYLSKLAGSSGLQAPDSDVYTSDSFRATQLSSCSCLYRGWYFTHLYR